MTVVQHSRGVRHTRRAALVAVVAAAGLVLAGCGTVPGAAVDVNGVTISQQTVAQRTDALLSENSAAGATVDDVTRSMLNGYQATDLVRHQLVTDAAKAEKINVDDAKVNAFISGNGGAASIATALNVPTADVHSAIYDYLVLQTMADKIPADGVQITNVTITIDAVPAADRAEAVADRAKYLKDPAALTADAAVAQQTGQVPGGEISLLAAAEIATTGLFTAPEGDIILYPSSGGSYLVMRVTKRSEKPGTLTKDVLTAAASSSQSVGGYLVLASLLLRKYAQQQDISVNPRFGVWDPKLLQVVPANSGL